MFKILNPFYFLISDALGNKLGAAMEEAFSGLGGGKGKKNPSDDYNFDTDFTS